jgi:RNA polymerase sigma-H factor
MIKLETGRLTLRDYIEDDLPDFHLLISDKENMRFLSDIATDTLEESRVHFRTGIENADGHYFCVRCRLTGAFIGSIGYTITSNDNKTVHMGYFILPGFQGKGLMTEAVGRVLEFAFLNDGRERVTTGCDIENIASRKVMDNIGFKKVTETARRYDCAMEKEDFFARRAKNGDNAALDQLIEKYMPMVNGIIGGYHIPGAEREDLMQEGLIGLYGAIMAYDPAKSSRFYFFAKLCVERRLNTAVKTALRGKHAPLRAYEPIPKEMRARTGTPEDIILGREELAALENAMNAKLSVFERKTLYYRLTGLGNGEIAELLNCSRKVIENALCRARKKINA